jgi:hypothetical protein
VAVRDADAQAFAAAAAAVGPSHVGRSPGLVDEGGGRRFGDKADAPHETAAIQADGGWLAGVLVCLWVAGGNVRLAGWPDLKQVAHAREGLASVALGEKAVVTDAVAAPGKV